MAGQRILFHRDLNSTSIATFKTFFPSLNNFSESGVVHGAQISIFSLPFNGSIFPADLCEVPPPRTCQAECTPRISANVCGAVGGRGNTQETKQKKPSHQILSERTIACREVGPPTKAKSHRGQNVSFKRKIQTFKWKYSDEPLPTTKCDGHKQ